MDVVLKILPSFGTAVGVVAILMLMNGLLLREKARAASQHRLRNQMILLALTVAGTLAFIMVLPISDTLRGQLLSLIGIVASAAIALSSKTFLGNALAGIMMRIVRNFRMGDFIRTENHFGRVSERGLFHVEIQTEDRELTTLPNLYLVTHPVTTVRSSGTIVAATVSLGYDVPRTRIESLLLDAARDAGLEEPYVQVLELGDFSVVYRVAGLLAEVKTLLSARSRLRAAMMDSLHEDGVEIVSPSFMSTRALATGHAVIPERSVESEPEPAASAPEELVFDKAEEAASLEDLQLKHQALCAEAESLEKIAKDAPEGAERDAAQRVLEAKQRERDRLQQFIGTRESDKSE